MIYFFVLLILGVAHGQSLAACTGSGTVYTCAAGTTPADIQTAITAASDGAILTFASGSYSWGGVDGTFRINNSKGVTLICEAVQACTVTVNGSSPCCSTGQLSGANTKNYRISGFVFEGGSGTVLRWYGAAGAVAYNVRIDNNWFKNATAGKTIIFGGTLPSSAVWGVIDHNKWTGAVNVLGVEAWGLGIDHTTSSIESIYASTPRGTINNVFVEDNDFDFTSHTDVGSGCVDILAGTGMVVRFNRVRNCQLIAHGTTHEGGSINFEIYGNAIIRDTGSYTTGLRSLFHQGSGESYVWGNTITHTGTISESALELTHYRSATPAEAGYGTTAGRCDGTVTNVWDGNTAPTGTYYGYPCFLQPGRAVAAGTPRWGTMAPLYVWSNSDVSTGALVSLIVSNPWGTSNPEPATHIGSDRDYFNAVSINAQTSATSPFNGTTGMGFGTLANRPTTCTHATSPDGDNGGGVGYWATDQGTWNVSPSNTYGVQQNGADGVLYRCSAANTWTVQYTPYQYPHPLQGISYGGTGGQGGMDVKRPVSAPKQLRVVNYVQ